MGWPDLPDTGFADPGYEIEDGGGRVHSCRTLIIRFGACVPLTCVFDEDMASTQHRRLGLQPQLPLRQLFRLLRLGCSWHFHALCWYFSHSLFRGCRVNCRSGSLYSNACRHRRDQVPNDEKISSPHRSHRGRESRPPALRQDKPQKIRDTWPRDGPFQRERSGRYGTRFEAFCMHGVRLARLLLTSTQRSVRGFLPASLSLCSSHWLS